jgi:CheY-like chemotaxis protein
MAMQKVKFLVVDDSPIIQREVCEFLEGLGHASVLTVNDGENAIAVLRETPDVGCIITGTKMPNLGGLGLLETVRKNDDWQRLPVLVMIEANDEATITLAATLGASGYIKKPLRQEVIRDKLAFILAPRPVDVVL